MKRVRRMLASLTALTICCSFSGGAYAEFTTSDVDITEKISDRLLEEYGITRETLQTANARSVSTLSTEEVPVLVWATEDIDHAAAERQAMPALVSESEISTFSARTATLTVDDVLTSDAEPSDEEVQAFIEAERAAAREMYAELNGAFVEENMSDMDVTFVSAYSPVVMANLTLDEVLELADSDATAEFDYYDSEIIEEMDISTQATKTDLVRTNYGYTGEGVKVGIVEGYIADATNVQLAPMGSRLHFSSTDDAVKVDMTHVTRVSCVLAGQSTANYSSGIAPGVDLYSSAAASFDGEKILSATEWALTQGVNVINASIKYGGDDDNSYSSFSKWLDHIAVNHYVTFVKSSGNIGSTGVTSGGMAYNIITVGNVDDKNTVTVSDDEISDTSSYYNANTNLAFKPDICAPGTGIVSSASPSGRSGTSYSAPHVTGAIALMFEARPTLKMKPAAVKAILTAAVSAETQHRYRPGDTNYRKYGAGLLDVNRAVQVAKDFDYRSFSVNSTNSQKTYTISVAEAGSTVRVSMSYLINNTATNTTHTSLGNINEDPIQDLDLWVYAPNGSLVGNSMSLHNNVEIAEFTAPQAGTYTVKVGMVVGDYGNSVEGSFAWIEW